MEKMTSRRITAAIAATLMATLSLTACGKKDAPPAATTTSSEAPAAAGPTTPTAAELAAILLRAVDPAVPTPEKTSTVVGGENAPEIFDALTALRAESKATLEVVEPVLPGIVPTQVLATMTLHTPGQQPVVVNDVQFNYVDGQWKLDQQWACTLIRNVLPKKLPPMCGAA